MLEEIRKLPLQEKLALMEFLWAEISKEPDQIEVPQWHRDMLDSRDAAFRRGEIQVIDWEEAKARISQRRK